MYTELKVTIVAEDLDVHFVGMWINLQTPNVQSFEEIDKEVHADAKVCIEMDRIDVDGS